MVGPNEALVIVNPTASRGAAARLWPRLAPLVARRFPDLTVRTTQAPGDAEHWAGEWAQTHPVHPVLAVGGDGTVHEVVNGLLRAGPSARLGVIPAGTGNDFARNTGIPSDPGAAVERLSQGRLVPVDAARLEYVSPGGVPRTRVFINSTSVGVSPRANHVAGTIRRILPGRIGYALGGVLALITEGAGNYTVTSSGRTLYSGRALNITLANGACFGGGMRISPASMVSDGVLDLVVIGDIGRPRALLALSRLYAGTHVHMGGIGVTPAKGTVHIRRGDGTMLIEADGEEFEATSALSVNILPGAIQVL